jgi:hypothetical protein
VDVFISLKVGLKEACIAFAVELGKEGVMAVEDLSDVTEAEARDMMTRAGMSKLQQNKVIQAEEERRRVVSVSAAEAQRKHALVVAAKKKVLFLTLLLSLRLPFNPFFAHNLPAAAAAVGLERVHGLSLRENLLRKCSNGPNSVGSPFGSRSFFAACPFWVYSIRLSKGISRALHALNAPVYICLQAATTAAFRILGKPSIHEAAENGNIALVRDHVAADPTCVSKRNDVCDSQP